MGSMIGGMRIISEMTVCLQDDNHDAAPNSNYFKIENAVYPDGSPVDLKYIDFVKVQCGVNGKSGWLGEISTEVFGVFDYKMKY